MRYFSDLEMKDECPGGDPVVIVGVLGEKNEVMVGPSLKKIVVREATTCPFSGPYSDFMNIEFKRNRFKLGMTLEIDMSEIPIKMKVNTSIYDAGDIATIFVEE